MNRPKEEIIAEFKEIINHAKDNNMEVILDVAPAVFDQLGISYSDHHFCRVRCRRYSIRFRV